MTRQFWKKNTKPKQKSGYSLENAPHNQVVLEKNGVVKKQRNKKKSEYSWENVPHDQAVFGKRQVWKQ